MRQNVWRIGLIDKSEYSDLAIKGLARVKITDKQPGILTKPLPVVFNFTGKDKSYAMPKIADRVIVLTDENCEDGVILGSIYTPNNLPPVESETTHLIKFEDGTKVEYDTETKILKIESEGSIELTCKGVLRLSSAGIIIDSPWINGEGTFNLDWTGEVIIGITDGNFNLFAPSINLN
jgi:phage baseplate assembly protein V